MPAAQERGCKHLRNSQDLVEIGVGVVSEAGAGAGPGGRGAQVNGASKEFSYSVPAEGMLSRNLHSFMGTGAHV